MRHSILLWPPRASFLLMSAHSKDICETCLLRQRDILSVDLNGVEAPKPGKNHWLKFLIDKSFISAARINEIPRVFNASKNQRFAILLEPGYAAPITARHKQINFRGLCGNTPANN